MEKSTASALKIACIYSLFSAIWIIFSDIAVELIVSNSDMITRMQTIKGWAFVIITALLLFFLVLKNYRIVERAFQLDGLTGMFSHAMFKNHLDRRITLLESGKGLIVIYMDVDNFKEINKTLGFDKADRFLLQLAHEIERCSQHNTIIGRLPPDQYIIAREYCSDDDIDSLVSDYQSLFNHTAKIYGIDSSCSIGVAIYPDDGESAKSLMEAAANSLTVSQQKGNAIQYHDKSLTAKANQRRQLLEDLREAIDNSSLTLVYQPKYTLDTMRVIGVEVLIRWHHPVNGAVSPNDFIPLAEESGLSPSISQLVIAKAAQELELTGLLGKQIQSVAINISATEFNHPELMDSLMSYLKQFPTLMPYVRIEITETATLNDMQQSAAIINKMRAEGLTFSVDDFGTGYTSLVMLKDFTIDEIKIDHSFVSDMGEYGRSKTIIGAIIAMAKTFDINVVAEGIETEEQLKELKAMGCYEAQGYYLGKPMNISALTKWVGS